MKLNRHIAQIISPKEGRIAALDVGDLDKTDPLISHVKRRSRDRR
jgi:hypothetical protein